MRRGCPTRFFAWALPALALASVVSVIFGGTGSLWSVPVELDGQPLRRLLIEVRLPRILVAALVGSALAVAGAALQGLFRNPLADPSVLGVSASAALFAQVTIFTGWALNLPWLLPAAASLGALVGTLVLLKLVKTAGQGALEHLVLGGVALGQIAVALSALLVSLALRDFTVAQRLLSWMLGSLDGRTWMHVLWGAGPVLAAGSWLTVRGRQLDGMAFGDTTAGSLGIEVRRLRREVVVATAILSGVAVAMAGIIAFVGLVVPHLVRRLVGAEHSACLAGSAVIGALVVVLADLGSRLVIAPAELQIGVITAALGAPWFLSLLRARLEEVAS